MNLKIEYISPALLVVYDKNSRTHSEAQITQIAASIQEFGFVNPILVGEKNLIVAGHGRLAASLALGLKQVPIIRLEHLSERQRKALTIADNKIALNAGWDFEKLAEEINELSLDDFDLDLLGFDEQELSAFLKDDESLLPEYANSAPKTKEVSFQATEPNSNSKSVCRQGDVWLLGGGDKLTCGENSNGDDLLLFWQQKTGIKAVHLATGKTFEQIKAERNG